MSIKSFIKRVFSLVEKKEYEQLQQQISHSEQEHKSNKTTIAELTNQIGLLTSQVKELTSKLEESCEREKQKEIQFCDQNTADKAKIEELIKQLSQAEQLEKLKVIRQQMAYEEVKRGKGRPPKGRINYHLMMDSDLKKMEKVNPKLAFKEIVNQNSATEFLRIF